eukprot:gene7909-8763_t
MSKEADRDDILSMVDVLAEDKALQEEATAVLGASDDQNCTYSLGYVDRQALYSCLSCTSPTNSTSAGVCFACSLHCHDGHDLVELYTKRNFRCDCGNSKFNNFSCKLTAVDDRDISQSSGLLPHTVWVSGFSFNVRFICLPEMGLTLDKDKANDGNSYNQNFQGKYCTCARPYPDPEDEIEDEMIQCVVCEDWYHSRHLGTLSPHEYQEMICDGCMSNLEFLTWYKALTVPGQEAQSGKGPMKSRKKEEARNDEDKDSKQDLNEDDHLAAKAQGANDVKNTKETASNEKTEDADRMEKGQRNAPSCKLKALKTGNDDSMAKESVSKAAFWQNHWRKSLCKCDQCKEMYRTKAVPFLLDGEDTVYEYEEKGKRKQMDNSSYEQGIRALSSMDRIKQVEVLTEYNDLKSELSDYLKEFAGEGKVVTKEDIETFFDGMKARKRQKMEQHAGMQFFCK